MNQVTYEIADPRGAVVASLLFGAISIFIGAAVAFILKGLAAPPDEPSYYGTTPTARRLIGGVVSFVLLAIFWYQFWGGFYTLTIADNNTIELIYRLPSRHYSVSSAGLQIAWVPVDKGQQALQLTTADGTTYTSQATTLSRDQRAAIESLLAGRKH